MTEMLDEARLEHKQHVNHYAFQMLDAQETVSLALTLVIEIVTTFI